MKIEGKDKKYKFLRHNEKDCSAIMAHISSEELAQLAQNGSSESFAELVRRYEGRLLLFMKHKTGNIADAEDLVQEAFIKAYSNIKKYRSCFRFSTWLFTIASRLAATHYKKLMIQTARQNEIIDNSSAEAVTEKESSDNLWLMAGNLPDNQYQVLWLKYIEDMSVKEISKVMGKSQTNVKVLLYRARINLSRQLRRS
jgi:RNA polymerase sigma-70 factor (ECF subfamily)